MIGMFFGILDNSSPIFLISEPNLLNPDVISVRTFEAGVSVADSSSSEVVFGSFVSEVESSGLSDSISSFDDFSSFCDVKMVILPSIPVMTG